MSVRAVNRRGRVLLLMMAIQVAGCALVGGTENAIEPEFNIRSSSVLIIRQNLAERHELLKAHYQAGAIGPTHNGLVAVRDIGILPAAIRINIVRLVAEDNKDRGTMFREIARANGRPDWESRFQSIFGTRWVNRAPADWYVLDSRGDWVQKKSLSAENGTSASTPLPFPER